MSEFKTVVEKFEDNQKKVIEFMQHEFGILKQDVGMIKHEIALLHEGRTVIRADLRKKVSYDDFEMLEKRVARLECTVI